MSKNSSARYYKKRKEKILKSIVKDVKIFLKKKNRKWEYGHERYRNLSKTEKQKQVENEKVIIKCEKTKTYYKKDWLMIFNTQGTFKIKSFNFIVKVLQTFFYGSIRTCLFLGKRKKCFP